MFAENLDALFVSTPNNVFFLTGFSGSFGRVLLFPNGKKILVSDARYSEHAQKICEKNRVQYLEINRNEHFWHDVFEKNAIKILGIESDDITLSRFSTMEKNFGESVEMVETSGIIEKMRLQKDVFAVQCMQKAAHIADACLKKVEKNFKEGISEKALAWIFEKTAKEKFGVEELSFPTIVAFGTNSAVPHHVPNTKKLENGMPILIDCGVKWKNFCSDMTRCFWFGEKNSEEFFEWEKAYNLVLKAQKLGIEKMKAGEKISSAEQAARKILGEQELFFVHSFGHGVGLDIHENPHISQKNEEKFLDGMVVTAEPGIYYPGKFGIRIEDMLMISGKNPKILSGFLK